MGAIEIVANINICQNTMRRTCVISMNLADHVIHTKDLVSVCISRRRHRALEVTSGHRHTLAIDEVTPRHARRRKALALEGLVTLRRRKALALEGLETLRRRKALLLHRHGDNQY